MGNLNGTAYKLSLHTGKVIRWILEGHVAEVKDGEENKHAFSLPQCSHHKTSNWCPRILKLGVVDLGMLESKILNSLHFDGFRIKPLGLPSVPSTSNALSTAEPGPARAQSCKYQELSKSCWKLLIFSELIEGLEQAVHGQEDHYAEP